MTVPVLLVYGENDRIEDIKNYINNIDKIQMDNIYNYDLFSHAAEYGND
jgi:hypothetical protein